MNVYELVTAKIMEKLEQGIIPWRKPWDAKNGAVNWNSQRPYHGINAMLLDRGEYATYKQVVAAGGKVKKGEHGHIVVLWQFGTKEETNPKTGKTHIEKTCWLKYFTVFEINTQCEGLEPRRKVIERTNDPIVEAEHIVEAYEDAPEITFNGGKAFYMPTHDMISVPPINDYANPAEYYSTLFHEMVHSTGHADRLNRKGITENNGFGSAGYSKEELIAEIGAAMLCGVAGIENSTLENSAAYIKSWLGRLKDDPKLVVTAAGAAQRAADYIQGIHQTQEIAEDKAS